MDCLSCVLARCFHAQLGLPPQYGLMRRLGRGAEGDVWLATDDVRNCLVAIKLIARGAAGWQHNMVGREGRLLCRLGTGHVCITRPLEIVLTSRHLAFISEYVPGGSLSDHIARQPFDEDTARYFFLQLIAAIRFLHAKQIAYRDIKPGNLLMTATDPPFLKLCDFGLAKSWEQEAKFETLAGTPGFMAPEIMSGFFSEPQLRAVYDGQSADVYSAGVLLVCCLLRTMPWHYDTYASRLPPLDAMRQLYQLEVQGVPWHEATHSASKLSPSLSALLDTMLEPDAAKRATLEQVAASEWVNLPLPPKLQAAIEVLQEQQAAREACAAVAAAADAEAAAAAGAGTGEAAPCAGGLSAAELAARLEAFESMLTAAESLGPGRGYSLQQRLTLDAGRSLSRRGHF